MLLIGVAWQSLGCWGWARPSSICVSLLLVHVCFNAQLHYNEWLIIKKYIGNCLWMNVNITHAELYSHRVIPSVCLWVWLLRKLWIDNWQEFILVELRRCFYCSVVTEGPQARQHRHASRHHSYKGRSHIRLWVRRKFPRDIGYFQCTMCRNWSGWFVFLLFSFWVIFVRGWV